MPDPRNPMTSFAKLERPKRRLRSPNVPIKLRREVSIHEFGWEDRCGASAVLGGDELPPLSVEELDGDQEQNPVSPSARSRSVQVRRTPFLHYCIAVQVAAHGTRIVPLKLQPPHPHTHAPYPTHLHPN